MYVDMYVCICSSLFSSLQRFLLSFSSAEAKYSLATCGWLHRQLHTHFYVPYLGYRINLPRVIFCTHSIFLENMKSESNGERDKQR